MTNHQELNNVGIRPEEDPEAYYRSHGSTKSVRKYEIRDETRDLYHGGGIVKKETKPGYDQELNAQMLKSQQAHHYRNNPKTFSGDHSGLVAEGYEK